MNLYDNRKYVLILSFIAFGLIFALRLLYLQVINDEWAIKAQLVSENRIKTEPSRGLIYDRNGELLVVNSPVYDLMITPRKVKEIDTLEFCELVGITKAEYIRRDTVARNWPNVSYKASKFISKIPADEFNKINEQLYKYPGFSGSPTTLRSYPNPIGAHVLGFLGEANPEKVKNDPFYGNGDYLGVSGIELYYEEDLRGTPGISYVLKDALGKIQGPYAEGKYDTAAVAGHNLYSTLDSELQAYGEKLMQNKMGSIVAIEPSTGEILAFISSPTYDPNLLVGRNRGNNYQALNLNDSLKPMFNRALMAPYPPGSIFKLVQAGIALEEGVITENQTFACNKSLVGCHNHPTCTSVSMALQHSCNPYFWHTAKRIISQNRSTSIFKDAALGLDPWNEHVKTFGLGQKLEIDLPNVKAGFIPNTAFYDGIYNKGGWAYQTIYSISIGQGEVSLIPLQMANLAAIMANGGWYYTPHLVQRIGENGTKKEHYLEKHFTSVSAKYYPLLQEGMRRAVNEPGGTARRARIDGITVCGKTGTAQNPHGEDHSVFIAFAPMENPQIAIAVFVENAGYGGTWSGPIASLMMEKHLTDSISDPKKEQRILDANIIEMFKK